MTEQAIEIKIYGANDEVLQTFSRRRIPWGVLKRAIRMASDLDEANITGENLDDIAGLISEAFGGAVTVEQLNQGGDIAEMIAAIQTIINKASATVPNQFPPVT